MSEKMIEVRWHSRAGQGGVTASKVLAESALASGKYVQAMPEYGAEREGAPIKAYTRISNDPILPHTQITDPDIVIVLDDSLLSVEDVTSGLAEGGSVIINTPIDPSEVRLKLKMKDGKVATIDATKISMDCIGRPIPNMPMIGALAKISGLIPVDMVIEDFKSKYGSKFSPKIVEGNIEAIKRAYEEVKIG